MNRNSQTQFSVLDGIDHSGRIIKLEKQVEKPICDSDNTKTTTRLKRIDGSFKLKREDLIVGETSYGISEKLISETIN